MLKQIKTFCVINRDGYKNSIPQLSDWEEAVRIAKDEACIVEVRWLPNIMSGYYHEYVFDNSNPAELDEKTPKVYGW